MIARRTFLESLAAAGCGSFGALQAAPQAAAAPANARDLLELRRARSPRDSHDALCRPGIEADALRAIAHGYRPLQARFPKLDALEPWTQGARPIADIALLLAADPWTATGRAFAQRLLELHEPFEIAGLATDLSGYKLVVAATSDARAEAAPKIDRYRSFGGSVLAVSTPAELTPDRMRQHLPKPAIVVPPDLPAAAEVTFLERRTPGGIRRTGHVLYFPDDQPGVLTNLQLSFRLPQHPLGVITAPDQRPLEFVHNEFLTTFTLARVHGHQAIAFE